MAAPFAPRNSRRNSSSRIPLNCLRPDAPTSINRCAVVVAFASASRFMRCPPSSGVQDSVRARRTRNARTSRANGAMSRSGRWHSRSRSHSRRSRDSASHSTRAPHPSLRTTRTANETGAALGGSTAPVARLLADRRRRRTSIRLPYLFNRVPQRVDDVIGRLHELRGHDACEWIGAIAIHGQLIDRVPTPRMHHEVVRLQEDYAFFHARRAFARRSEFWIPVPLQIRNRLRPRRIRADRPLPRHPVIESIEKLWEMIDLTADAIHLAVNVEHAPLHPTPDEDSWIDGVAPIGAEIKDRGRRCLELRDTPIAEHARLTVPLVLPEPDMRVLLGIAIAVVRHLSLQHLGEPRIVPIRRGAQDRVVRRRRPAEQRINRIGGLRRIPRKTQLPTWFANRRAQEIKTALAECLRFLDPRDRIRFERLDGIGRVILHALKDNPPASWRLDVCRLDAEARRHPPARDHVFEQSLDGLLETDQVLADAHGPRRREQAPLDQEIG